MLDECHSDQSLAGLDGNSKFQRLVWSAAAAGAPASSAAGVSANGRQLHALTIDRDFDLLGIARCRPGDVDLHQVIAVNREITLNRQSAARSKRKLVKTFILGLLRRQPVDVDHNRHFRITDGEPADLARRIEISLHRCRRDEQQIRDVVETAADVVGRKQQREIHLFRKRFQREQIANRILVFRPAQAMQQRQCAGIRLCCG